MPKSPKLSHLGLRVTGRVPGAMTFFTNSDEVSHTLAIMKLGPDAPGPVPARVGLYHFACQVDSPEELKAFYQHLKEKGTRIVGMGDHGISQGIYFLDPDENEIEVFYELPRSRWPDPDNPFDNVSVKPFSLE